LGLAFLVTTPFKLGSGDGELRADDYLGEILVLTTTRPTMRSEPGGSVAVAIVASRAPGRYWV
jgi:hypothetical protein